MSKARVLPCGFCGQPMRPSYPSERKEFCSVRCRSDAHAAARRRDPSPPPVAGACWIPLGDNRWALVDESRYQELSRYTWGTGGSKKEYAATKVGGTTIYMHHLVVAVGVDRVDHKNGNGYDNRRENLREASQRQNTGNMRSRAKKAPYKGIALQPNGAWQARIRMPDGRRPSLGSFSTPEEAARAYDTAAREVHGEFACVNFPIEGERGALDS